MIRFSCEPSLINAVQHISRLVPATSATGPIDVEFRVGEPGFQLTLDHDLRSTITIRASRAEGYATLLHQLREALKMLPAGAGAASAIACLGAELGRARGTTRRLAVAGA